jgi:SNF2 family DNA or RNA helicase
MDFPNGFTPLKWQSSALIKFQQSDLNNFILLAEVGTGKTFTAISLLRMVQEKIGQCKILVICPGVVIHNWRSEIRKFSFPQDFPTIHTLDVSAKRADKMKYISSLNEKAVVVTNYESMDQQVFYKHLTDWKPDVIVCDEIHRIKSYQSKRAKKVVTLGEYALYRFGLTGTAILNTPMDVFMQWCFLDQGESFGKSFFNFRNRYFYDANGSWSNRQNHFPDFKPVPELLPEITHKIERNSIKALKSECLDLPPFIQETVKLKMSPKQKLAYDQMHKDFITFIHGEDGPAASVANIALTKGLRLMQIASGFVGLEDGTSHSFEDNPKMEALGNILDEYPQDKVIIWCSFRQNYSDVSRLLLDRKEKFVTITGDQDSKEKQEAIDAFQNDPEVKRVIANRKAGGIGISLTAASISVIVSRTFSLEEEIQAQARNYRNGSQIHDKITEISLIMEDSIEEKVVEALQNKQKISDIILDFK